MNNQSKIPISFGWTSEQLLSGNKTVTRRTWKDNYAQGFINRFNEGVCVYPALNKSYRNGGEQIGSIQIYCCPYKQRLVDMPIFDLELEGFPELTKQEFIDKFFGGDELAEVWVVRFINLGKLRQHRLYGLRGQAYVKRLKEIYEADKEAIKDEFERIVDHLERLTPLSLGYLCNKFNLPVTVMDDYLSSLELIPSGTWERLKDRGCKARDIGVMWR